MSGRNNKDSSNTPTEEQGRPSPMNRRALLKGAATAMPMILTLQSGAALARSSNLISESPYGYKDENGRILCLELDSVYAAGESGHRYDLGEPPYARVTRISNRDYRKHPKFWGRRVSEKKMCEEGRSYYYRDRRRGDPDDDDDYYRGSTNVTGWGAPTSHKKYSGKYGWKKVKVPQGMLVSATALSSFAGHIVITDL